MKLKKRGLRKRKLLTLSNKGKEIYPLDLIMKLIGGNNFIAILGTEDKSQSVEDEKYI